MRNKALFPAFVALFAALICVGCFMRIPVGAMPIVLQNALCVLTGVLLGGIQGGAPTLLFVAAGAVGLPVFSGGTGGIAVLLGPTGGFVPGYLLGAVLAGFVAGRPSVEERRVTAAHVLRIALAIVSGMVVLYVPGVLWFARWAAGNVSPEKMAEAGGALRYTMAACVLPFIPGDMIKIVICVPLALRLRPLVAQYLYA